MKKKYCHICERQLAKDERKKCPNCKKFVHLKCGYRTRTLSDSWSSQPSWYCKKCVNTFKKGLTEWKREEGYLPPTKKEREHLEMTEGFYQLFDDDGNIVDIDE